MFKPWSDTNALDVVREHSNRPGPVLITLQALQSEFGWIKTSFLSEIAKELNVSKAEVHGVLTYYSDLRTSPPPEHHIQICVAEACQSMGAESLVAELSEKGFDFGRSRDGSADTTKTYCLGNCALSPAAAVDGELIGKATATAILARMDKR
jgi:formate dehydrogenase subunit gamma